MSNSKFYPIFILVLLIPQIGLALELPKNGNDLAAMVGINAQAYVVQDVASGKILIDKNADLPWAPASLTKLVTAIVVLDTKPKFSKPVVMTADDQTAGSCGSGGACIRSKPGVKFTVDGLLHAALIPSANNAANALARSTGLSSDQFAARMNKKVASLGTTNTHFNEPTGMDPTNQITAGDYAKIVAAAFSYPYLRETAALSNYNLRSTNNSKYNQTIKTTDKLLADADVQILGAKTGYLNESGYNFASLLTLNGGQELVVVVLGEQHLYSAFAETKTLANLARDAEALALLNNIGSAVLGTTTGAITN